MIRRTIPDSCCLCVLGAAALLVAATARAQPAGDPATEKLVQQIAAGSEHESREATDLLVEKLTAPLAAALGAMEQRPVEEQLRLRQAVSTLAAAVRVKVLRAELPAPDRALLDAIEKQHPELVRQLFESDYRRRLTALRQIPLEPNTGAGILVAEKVNDEHEEVAVAALEIAASLHDDVVARGLVRFIEGATTAIRAGYYGPSEQETAATVVIFIDRAIRALGEARYKPGVPAAADAARFLGQSVFSAVYFDRGAVALALGRIQDERATPLLLEWLEEPTVRSLLPADQSILGTQTNGDAALLALLNIYALSPEAFGFIRGPGNSDFIGFRDDNARDAGHKAFRAWYADNQARPAGQRSIPTSLPARG